MSKVISYKRYGDTCNDPLVLLHSGGMAGVEWKPQIKSLSQHYDVFVPDLPGHGQSVIPNGESLSIAMMAHAVIDMLSHAGIDKKVHICGSSMGGAVALWLGIYRPNILHRLIIYRISYRKNTETHNQTTEMANPMYWKQYGLHTWLSQLHEPQGDADSWKTVIANVSKILDPMTSDHSHTLEDLQKISAKTLLIAGDRDPLIPLSELLAMHQTIPDCALWVMPHATHITASNTWRAEAFAQELIRFLAK